MEQELTLDDLNRRLAAIQDQLLAAAPDDFTERHRLRTEQDRLRRQTGQYRQDGDKHRSDAELLAELKAREATLDEFRKKMPEAAKAAASGFTAGSWSGPGDVTQINEKMKSAQSVADQMQRVSHLEGILKERGVL